MRSYLQSGSSFYFNLLLPLKRSATPLLLEIFDSMGQSSPIYILAGLAMVPILFTQFQGISTDLPHTTPVNAGDGQFSVVLVTVPSKEVGRTLANGLITNKLAACVNIIPGVESHYWWEGKVVSDSEMLLIIKTRASVTGAINDYVKKNHPYTVPEVISLGIVDGNIDYMRWLEDSVHKASDLLRPERLPEMVGSEE